MALEGRAPQDWGRSNFCLIRGFASLAIRCRSALRPCTQLRPGAGRRQPRAMAGSRCAPRIRTTRRPSPIFRLGPRTDRHRARQHRRHREFGERYSAAVPRGIPRHSNRSSPDSSPSWSIPPRSSHSRGDRTNRTRRFAMGRVDRCRPCNTAPPAARGRCRLDDNRGRSINPVWPYRSKPSHQSALYS